jgi:hypothetical protein
VSQLIRRGASLTAVACLISSGLASSALASSTSSRFRPRIGNALGLVPPVGKHNLEPSEFGIYAPLTYHGGKTMTGGVTVHTLFWAPPGYAFQTAPPNSKSYVGLIEQYFSDVNAASTGTLGAPCTHVSCNSFTVEPQYAWGTRPGGIVPGKNQINYSAGSDVVMDTDPYNSQCTSPQDTKACVTDGQVQAEVDKVVQATPGHPRGLHNLWFVFLPPNVDECIGPDECDSNAFGGYHSVSNLGHGPTVYAVAGDPIIEVGGVPQGEDPQGNPDAEITLDIAVHETNEAISDPEGTGYMDPNGFEVGDKCEFGDQKGTPLGYAPNGAPYNQVVNHHEYFLQEMWSNDNHGCVQATSKTSSPLPLPQVNLTQFSSRVTGNTEDGRAGIAVKVRLVRSDASGNAVTVATGSGRTSAGGSWTARLSGGHTVGDDRDQIEVDYSGSGAPKDDLILTGNGGNPFTLSGWTGWTALDEGSALTNFDPAFSGPSLSIGPCYQAGVLRYAGASGPEPATKFCGLSGDVADTPLNGPVNQGDHVTVSSSDNRAFAATNLPGGGNPTGALVKLTVPVGEPDAAPNFPGDLFLYLPTGFPVCKADLGAQRVTCTGLVPFRSYTLTDHARSVRGKADLTGVLSEPMTVTGGDTVRLSNAASTLSALHVARLRVHLHGSSSKVASGTCSPDEYWGGPLRHAPTSQFAGEPTVFFGGGALTGAICPRSGRAAGFPAANIAQTDERSGGETVTEVANVASTSPLNGETMYGRFRAVVRPSAGRPRVSLKIVRASGKNVFRAANVDTRRGVEVRGLEGGNYTATWTVYSRDGDTRTVNTRFVEQR